MTRMAIVAALSTLLVAAGCGKSESSGSGGGGGGGGSAASNPNDALYKQSDSADNLKGLLDTIMKSSEAGDAGKAAALIRGILPDKASLMKALKDDAPAAFVDECVKQNQSIPAEDAAVAGLFKRGGADRTEVSAHAATTEEIAKYEEGSVPFKEFPGGARKLAEQVLRPGMTFYEVVFHAPGEDSGMKFHLFYWDGTAWKMLGPAWRALK